MGINRLCLLTLDDATSEQQGDDGARPVVLWRRLILALAGTAGAPERTVRRRIARRNTPGAAGHRNGRH